MSKQKKRRGVVLGIAAGFALFVAVGIPEQAQAAISPVTPLSVLPSQIVSGTSAATTADASVLRMAQVYKFLTAPSTVAALKSQAAGTATAAEEATIANAASASKIPLGVGGLLKVAGGVGVAYSGYKIGTMMGAPVAGKITTSLWGLDANDLVCEQAGAGSVGQGMLSFFAGQNCSDFNARADQPLNSDVSSGAAQGKLCDSAGNCVTMTGVTYKRLVSSASSVWAAGDDKYEIPIRCALQDVHFNDTGLTLILKSGATQPANFQPAEGRWGNAGYEDANDSCTHSSATQYELAWGWKNQSAQPDEIVGFQLGDQVAPITAAPADPDRTISCDIVSSDGKTYSTSGGTFKESQADWTPAIPTCPTLDAGQIPSTTSLVLHTIGGADQTLWTHDLSTEQKDSLDKYSDCLRTVCQLILEKQGVSCFDSTDLCTGWFADTHKEDTYTCRYDGQQVELTECNVYAPSWEPDATTTGKIYADPVTGKAAAASPDVKENTAVSPDLGGKIANQPATKGESCYPTGYGVFNPLEWVQKPVQCAFTWAFVPDSTAVSTALTKLQTKVDSSPAGEIQTAVSGWSFHEPSGCAGLRIDVFFLGDPFYIANACPGSVLAPMATWSSIFGVISSVVLGFISVRRSIAGVAEFNA